MEEIELKTHTKFLPQYGRLVDLQE